MHVWCLWLLTGLTLSANLKHQTFSSFHRKAAGMMDIKQYFGSQQYYEGELLKAPSYAYDQNLETLTATLPSNETITLWAYAIDVRPCTDACADLPRQGFSQNDYVVFHYTDKEGFDNITSSKTIWASTKAAEDANFGFGVYGAGKAPHQFRSKAEIFLNNFLPSKKDWEERKHLKFDQWPSEAELHSMNGELSQEELDALLGSKFGKAVLEYWEPMRKCDFCIPIICDYHSAKDVMKDKSFAIEMHTNKTRRAGENKFGEQQPAWRDVWTVVRSEKTPGKKTGEWQTKICHASQPEGLIMEVLLKRRAKHHQDQVNMLADSRKKKTLDILEKDPRPADPLPIDVRDLPEKHQRIVVIGDTGAGKSAFCGLLDGSLEFVEADGSGGWWRSSCKLGHGGSSETNEPKLLPPFRWLGHKESDAPHIICMDTPGLGDSRGPQIDDLHMAEVAKWVNGLGYIHAIVIVLKNDPRIAKSLRTNLEFFQQKFGPKMWEHTLIVVNRWSHSEKDHKKRARGKMQSAANFQAEFQQMLQMPTSRDARGQGQDAGVGLSKETAEKVPFFFVDTHYERDDEDEKRSMEDELDSFKRFLLSLEKWQVTATAQSPELKLLIDTARKTNLAHDLQAALDAALNVDPRPWDLTQEKLKAVEEEIAFRAKEDLKKELAKKARDTFQNFLKDKKRQDAQDFIDMLREMRVAGVAHPQDLLQIEEVLLSALQGNRVPREKFQTDMLMKSIEPAVENLSTLIKKEKDMESWIIDVFTKWNLTEKPEVAKRFSRFAMDTGISVEADLRFLFQDNTVRACLSEVGRSRLQLLSDWHAWIAENCGDVGKLEQLCSSASAAKVQPKLQKEMADRLMEAKQEAGREVLRRALDTKRTDDVRMGLTKVKGLNVPDHDPVVRSARAWLKAKEEEAARIAEQQRKASSSIGQPAATYSYPSAPAFVPSGSPSDTEKAEAIRQLEKNPRDRWAWLDLGRLGGGRVHAKFYDSQACHRNYAVRR